MATFWRTFHHEWKISPAWSGECTPTPFHNLYYHVISCRVRSSWEGRYSLPISTLPLYVLCGLGGIHKSTILLRFLGIILIFLWLEVSDSAFVSPFNKILFINKLKGAQAWDIRERFFYTNRRLMGLGDFGTGEKNWNFETWSHNFKAKFLLSVRSACA
jgi:hypothetical protein